MYLIALAAEWWNEAKAYRLHLKLILVVFMTFVFSFVYWLMRDQRHWNDNLARPQLTFMDTLYFSATTSSTIGFGDITPKTTNLRLAVLMQMLLTFAVVVF